MDPNVNLAEQLRLAAEIQTMWNNCLDDGSLKPCQAEEIGDMANRLSELVGALNNWIIQGGFLPTLWQRSGKR